MSWRGGLRQRPIRPSGILACFLQAVPAMDGPHLEALQQALKIVGDSKERLAAELAVPLADLEEYLVGEDVPYQVFLSALDIISGR